MFAAMDADERRSCENQTVLLFAWKALRRRIDLENARVSFLPNAEIAVVLHKLRD